MADSNQYCGRIIRRQKNSNPNEARTMNRCEQKNNQIFLRGQLDVFAGSGDIGGLRFIVSFSRIFLASGFSLVSWAESAPLSALRF